MSKRRQFKTIPATVEAFQMTRERRDDNSEWPDWLNDAWNKAWGEPGALLCDRGLYPGGLAGERLILWSMKGAQGISWDDWIVRSWNGELSLCDSQAFKSRYEPVDPDMEADATEKSNTGPREEDERERDTEACGHTLSLTTCGVCYSILCERASDRNDMLEDIHKAWLALAEGDIDGADRYLIKWVSVYRENNACAATAKN